MSLLTETSFSVTLIGTSGVGITSFLSTLPTDKPNLLEIQDQVMNQTLSFSLYKNDEGMVPKSICLLLVYDITNKSTFSFVTQKYLSYKNKLQQGKYFVVLLGNKCDLDKKRAVPTQEAEIFASQYGLFFLEISTATRKNIELVLKVIRIRTVHLMKKLQNKNSTSGTPSLTDISTKSSHKENTEVQVDKYKVPAKPPTSGKSLGILQKNFNLPRSLSPALPRPESQKIEEEKKSTTMLKESPNRDKLKELKGEDLRKSIALLMEQEENSTGARPLPALPKPQEPTVVDKTYSSPKKVTNIAQILQENNGNNASSFDKENVLNLSRQSNAQGIKSERSIIEEKVMALSRGSSPNTNRSLPKITQGQGSASKQNKSWQDKENNPEIIPQSSLTLSQKQKEIPIKYTFSGTKDTGKSIRRLDSSGSKADSKILDEIQPMQNIEGMIKNQTIPQIHYHVSINPLEVTPQLQQINKQHSPLMPVNTNIPKHTKQDSSFNLKISQVLEDKQNMSTYSHHVPPFPPLLDVSQDLVPESDKREEQASLLFMNQNGEESFRFHEEPPAVVKPQKVLDFIPSLNLKQEDRNDLPYKAPDVNNNNNNHKRDLPLQTPQFKLGQNDPKNFTLKPPQQKSGSQIIGAGIAPPQSDELRLEEGGLDSLSRRKDSYRVLHSEYDNYMSPKEPEDTLRKDSLNNTGKITQETAEDNQNTHNTVKSEENSRVMGNKNKLSECDEIMGTIDKNIKLLEDSLYSLDANLSLTKDGPETKIKRSHSVSFKPVKQSNLLSVEEQLQESTAKKPKKKKSLKKKREKSADTSAVAKDLNFMGAEKDTLRSSFNDGKESTRTKNLLVSPKSTRRKSTSIHLASDENENSSVALLYLQFEDNNDISELVPVYADDDAYSVAERYCDGKNIKLDWPRFKVLAKLVEEKINATSMTIEAMILQNGNLSFEEKNIHDQSRSRRDTRTPRITTGRQTSRNAADESIIGKIYIELENKKIVVLNVKEHDEPNTIALRFLSLHSIKREHYKTIVSYIQEIQETYREHDGGIGECIVRNVVLKELKAHDLSARKSASKENIPTSKSPMRSRGLVLTSKSQSQGQPPSQNQAQGINKVLFKLNFDVGKGRIAKLMVKQGDDRSKIAQNFVLTHKLSPQAYERIYEVIERTYKNKIRQDESSMNLENVIFKAE